MKLSGWGRYPVVDAEVAFPVSVSEVEDHLAEAPLTIRGLGRSYGDCAVGARVLDLTGLDNFISFDSERGVLRAQAGVSLHAILQTLLPLGWFLPVIPGTRFVTLGGAIAADVHGKNHHRDGALSQYVESMTLLTGDGSVIEATSTSNAEVFRATCGGMGLTGVIVEATLRLVPVSSRLIEETVVKTGGLRETVEVLSSRAEARYSVSWVDLQASGSSLGRSLVMLGEHSSSGGLGGDIGRQRVRVPELGNPSPLNRYSVSFFNELYYRRVRQQVVSHTIDFVPFFFPLDAVANWNRLYGSAGFFQYQFVIPTSELEALIEIVGVIADSGQASPLAVLKVMGEQNENLMSFPMEGFTLAVDFRVSRESLELADALDTIVLGAGGRCYLAKDSRMAPETFRAMYPKHVEFLAVREALGSTGFESALSSRLEIA